MLPFGRTGCFRKFDIPMKFKERASMRIFASLLFVLLIMPGCGKRGPLIYPDMLIPAAPTGVTARQSGRVVKLSFVVNRKDRAGRDLKEPGVLGGVDVFRRASSAGREPVCKACLDGFVLLKKLYLESSPLERDVQRFGGTMLLLDGDVRTGGEYSYMVRPFTKDSVDGQPSTPVKATVVEPLPPPALTVEPDPVEIRLHFDGSYSGRGTLVGYNIYRTVKDGVLPYAPFNREPVVGNSFADIGLDRSLSYVYAVRAVVRTPDGQVVESELSNEVIARLPDL